MDAHGLIDASCCPSWPRCAGVEQNEFHHADVLRPHARGARRGRRARAGPRVPRRPRRRPARRAARRRAHARRRDALRRAAARRRQAADPRRAAGRARHVHRPRRGRAPSWRAPCCAACARPSGTIDYVAALTLHHLRLGFLVHEQPLDRRAIWRYLRATAPWTRRRHDLHRRRPARHARPQRRGGDRRPRRARARACWPPLAAAHGAADPRRRPGARARDRPRPAARRAAGPARGGPLRRRDRHPRGGDRARPAS